MQVQALMAKAVTISCYENQVPPFVGVVLDCLYESLFSSLALFRIYNPDQAFSTYVARREGSVIALFLFRHEGGRVQVCNEVIRVDADEVTRFSRYIFDRFAGVTAISFRAVENDIRHLPYPYQRFNTLEDIVLTLPDTVETYLASLGKATRRTIRGGMNRLQRAYPSFCFRVTETSEIAEQDVMAVIRMNQARMAGKDKVSSYDEAESQRLCRLARVCGLVGLLVLDGHICAGAVSFRVGSNYFMSLSAHDPGYDEYRLGTLSGFLNISECIRRGGRECHLLWGQHDYKFRFLGVERALDNLTVYRSLPAMLRNMETVLTMSAQGNMRRLQRWLQEARRNEALPWRAASLLEMFWRRARRQLGSRSVPPVLPEALQNGLPEQEQN